MTKNEKNEIKLELKAAKYVRDRIKTISSHARKRKDDKLKETEMRAQELTQYQSVEEAQEAYGWGYITEQEYNHIVDLFEGREGKVNDIDVDDMILNWTHRFLDQLNSSINEYEYLLMTPEEQEKYQQSRREIEEMKRKRR